MMYDTINTYGVIREFRQMMLPNSPNRVMRLIGDGKMGKSHLLTKVLPSLSRQEFQAGCSILDLRNSLHSVPDILHMACSQLGTSNFDGYYEAHQSWMNRPKVEVKGLLAKFSRIDISAKDNQEDTRSRDRQLTTKFVHDLTNIHSELLLLFDSVSDASAQMQSWLLDTFLIQVAPLSHVRVIMAGRTLPEAHGSYAYLCQSYHLRPVTDVEEYITYCKRLESTLSEQSIRDFAHACDYTPGMFAELVVPRFVQQRPANG
jgi:hypothetical protein